MPLHPTGTFRQIEPGPILHCATMDPLLHMSNLDQLSRELAAQTALHLDRERSSQRGGSSPDPDLSQAIERLLASLLNDSSAWADRGATDGLQLGVKTSSEHELHLNGHLIWLGDGARVFCDPLDIHLVLSEDRTSLARYRIRLGDKDHGIPRTPYGKVPKGDWTRPKSWLMEFNGEPNKPRRILRPIGRDPSAGRDVFLLTLSDAGALSKAIDSLPEFGACLLVWDLPPRDTSTPNKAACDLQRIMPTSLFCWGSNVSRVRDAIDELHVLDFESQPTSDGVDQSPIVLTNESALAAGREAYARSMVENPNRGSFLILVIQSPRHGRTLREAVEDGTFFDH